MNEGANFTISQKQQEAFNVLSFHQVVELFMGGSAGGPQPLDALVKTPSGYRTIGSLKVGDTVCSYNGGVAFVVDIPYEGIDPIVRLDTQDGRSVTASTNHLFPVQLTGEKRPKLRRVSEIVKAFNSGQEQWLLTSDNGIISSVKLYGHCPTGVGQVRCISVSTLDGLYITNDGIITHNSKTFTMCMMALMTCKNYPGARLLFGRKTLTSMRRTVLATLFGKVHPMFGVKNSDYHFNSQTGELHYKNGSMIMFAELKYIPTDPDFERFGSIEIDMAFIEEAGEITLEAKNAVKSRIGRGVMSQRYDIPGKLILSGNPSLNFLRQEYYEPYIKHGGGEYQKWQIGEVTIRGDRKPSYRAFLRISVFQNPFMPQSYIDNLLTLPEKEKKRLLYGDWDYTDDSDSLFQSALIDKATTFDIFDSPHKIFDKFIGVDVSDKGKDLTIFSLIENGVLVAQVESQAQRDWEKGSKLPLSGLIADELIKFAQQHGFTSYQASHIAVEANGVGVGVRDMLKERGWQILEYQATGKSRSENYHNLKMAMDSGDIKILGTISTMTELRKQLMAHTYKMDNQQPVVCKKDVIKQRIGKSPDNADSLMIASFAREYRLNPKNNQKYNQNRILW